MTDLGEPFDPTVPILLPVTGADQGDPAVGPGPDEAGAGPGAGEVGGQPGAGSTDSGSGPRRPAARQSRPGSSQGRPDRGRPATSPSRPRPGQAVAVLPHEEDEPGVRPRMDPRFAERWARVRREQGRHRLRLLLVAVGFLVVVSLAVAVLYSPLLNVRHIRISAPPTMSRQQVLAIAGLSHPRPLIDIDTAKITAQLDAVPTLGAARVRKQWPATVDITVTSRTPIAVVPRPVPATGLSGIPGASDPAWATVDATGRVLAEVQAEAGLPVVQGTGEVPPPGGWLSGSAGPHAIPPAPASSASLADLHAPPDSTSVPGGTAAALAIVAALPPSLRDQVLSVTVAPGNQLRMAVLAPTATSAAVSVNLGDGSQLAAKLTALATLLAQANLTDVAQIDLTVPDRPATLTAR